MAENMNNCGIEKIAWDEKRIFIDLRPLTFHQKCFPNLTMMLFLG